MKKLVICCLVFVCYLFLGNLSLAAAMGGAPPEKKEEPKYKLEILKMDVVSGQAQTLESTATADGEKPKYKLEILKMDVITAPSPSSEVKAPKPQ